MYDVCINQNSYLHNGNNRTIEHMKHDGTCWINLYLNASILPIDISRLRYSHMSGGFPPLERLPQLNLVMIPFPRLYHQWLCKITIHRMMKPIAQETNQVCWSSSILGYIYIYMSWSLTNLPLAPYWLCMVYQKRSWLAMSVVRWASRRNSCTGAGVEDLNGHGEKDWNPLGWQQNLVDSWEQSHDHSNDMCVHLLLQYIITNWQILHTRLIYCSIYF